MMKLGLSIVGMLAVGCVGKDGATGEMGAAGSMGGMGSSGTPGTNGERLVWKDPAGNILPDAFVTFSNPFGGGQALMMRDSTNGVFYMFDPLTGLPLLLDLDPTYELFTTTNCSGGPVLTIPASPLVAFQLGTTPGSPIVALPVDVAIVKTSQSYNFGGGCSTQMSSGAYVLKATLDALPNLTPPALAAAPYHIDKG